MLKHIKIASLLFVFSLFAMFLGIIKNKEQFFALSRGNYFFENTRNNARLKIIRIEFDSGQTINIENKDGFWRIKEADDYYASFSKVTSLVNLIHNTTIYRTDVLTKQDALKFSQGNIHIKTIDASEKIIDDAVIAPKFENNKYFYAKLNQHNFLYQLTEDFSLSRNVMDWVQAPLLKIDRNQIKRIKTDTFEVYRQFNDEELKIVQTDKEVPHIRRLINNLWYLSAEEIRHAVHFDRQQFKLLRTFDITTSDGIIYQLSLFSNGSEYWLNIFLDREFIISNEASLILKENRILYDGWYFRIANDKGEAISNFSI